MNDHTLTYAMAIIPAIDYREDGKPLRYYAELSERDSGSLLWTSRLYDTAQDAFDFGWYEWQHRAAVDQDAAKAKRNAEVLPLTEDQQGRENGVSSRSRA